MKNLESVINTQKNLIVEGSVNSGKTSNVLFKLVENKIKNKENLFILDSKEEYLNNFYKSLNDNNYNTIIINLRDTVKSVGWNPLEYPYNLYKSGKLDLAQEELERLGTIIFSDDSSIDNFWTNSASDFFIGLTLALFEDGEEDEINLNSVFNMLNYMDKPYKNSNYLEEYFTKKDMSSTSYIFASNTINSPTETKGGIISTFRQKLRCFISMAELSNLLNKTTFNIDESKPFAIIFICKDEYTLLNTLPVMFIEQLYSKLISDNIACNFILDNFDVLSNSLNIIDILGSCLARNIQVAIGTRSISKKVADDTEYIKKLCDVLELDNISITNNQNINKTNDNIKYPFLDKKDIKLFDIAKLI